MTQPRPVIKPATSDRAQFDDYYDRLEADLRIAERVHRSMIPANERRGNLEIVCDFQPMIGVGGDYASVHFQNDQRVVVGICDVAGHGVASALLASRVNSFVLHHAPRVCHPCELVDSLNEFVFRTFRDAGLYLTHFSLYIDLGKQTIVGAGCGHPPVFHYVKEEDVIRRMESENTAIGLLENLSRPCSMLQVPFKPGDRLVLYTDGLTESTNPDEYQLGVDGLEKYFKESAHLPLKECVDAIIRRVRGFREDVPANDDQLLLAISYLDRKAPSPTNSERRVNSTDAREPPVRTCGSGEHSAILPQRQLRDGEAESVLLKEPRDGTRTHLATHQPKLLKQGGTDVRHSNLIRLD